MSIKLSEAYSMGKQKREAQFIQSKDIEEVPGPGQYSPSVKTTKGTINPAWSLSKDQRDKLMSNTGPGPGSYLQKSRIAEGPKYHLGLKQQHDWVSHKGEPGPGKYDPKKPKEHISYSIRLKSASHQNPDKQTPGPGQYSDLRESYYKQIPGSKIGSDVRKAQFLKTAGFDKPAPGSYKTISFVDRKSAPLFGFGSSKREKDYLSSTMSMPPGPGHYQSKNNLGEGQPNATMPGRRKDLRPKTGRDAPGAGNYDPNYKNLRRSSPNFSITKQTRDGELALYPSTPGIGSYFGKDTLTKSHSATWRIGTEHRPKQQQYVPPTPGPGKYSLEFSKTHGPAYHISGRESRNVQQSPGPGQYKAKTEYNSQLNRAPSFSVGGQARVTIKELNQNPGPGIYVTSKNSYLFTGPKFGFGSSQRMPSKTKPEPGPGSYKIPTQIGNVPSYSMPNRSSQSRYV